MTDTPITDPEPMHPDVRAEAEQRLGLAEAIEREIAELMKRSDANGAKYNDMDQKERRDVNKGQRCLHFADAQAAMAKSLERILKDWRNE